MSSVSILIATYGSTEWRDAAWSQAFPSAQAACRGDRDEVKVVHQSDGTLAAARNRAARMASGDWLCFLDADDQLDPGYLKAMEKPMFDAEHRVTPAVFSSGVRVQDPRLETRPPKALLAPAVDYGTAAPAIPNQGRWPDLNVCVIGTLVPAWLFNLVEGFREWPSLEDWELWLRCVKAGASIVPVPDAVYVANVNPNGRNRSQDPYQEIRRLHAELFR